MRASSSRQGVCFLLPDTYYLLRVVTALASIASLTRSLARPGQEPGLSLLLAVVRTTNERTDTAAKNTPRRRRHQHAALCTGCVVLALTLLLALLSHLALPVLRKDTPRAHTCCKAYAGSRAREPMYGCRIVQWTRRLPCAACMHAAEACVRCVDQRTSASKSSDGRSYGARQRS